MRSDESSPAPRVFQVFAGEPSGDWRLVFDVKFLINAYCRLYNWLVSHGGANSQEGVGVSSRRRREAGGEGREGGCFSSYIRHHLATSLWNIQWKYREKSVILWRHQYLWDVCIVFILKSRFIVKLCWSPRKVGSLSYIFFMSLL